MHTSCIVFKNWNHRTTMHANCLLPVYLRNYISIQIFCKRQCFMNKRHFASMFMSVDITSKLVLRKAIFYKREYSRSSQMHCGVNYVLTPLLAFHFSSKTINVNVVDMFENNAVSKLRKMRPDVFFNKMDHLLNGQCLFENC